MRNLLFIFLLCLSASAHAAPEVRARKPSTAEPTTYLDTINLTSDRSFQVDNLLGFDSLCMTVEFTHANNGVLTLTCTVNDDGFETSKRATPTTCALANGTCNIEWAGIFVTPSLTDDKTYKAVLGLNSDRGVECTIGHGGSPAAGDTVKITGFATTSGR